MGGCLSLFFPKGANASVHVDPSGAFGLSVQVGDVGGTVQDTAASLVKAIPAVKQIFEEKTADLGQDLVAPLAKVLPNVDAKVATVLASVSRPQVASPLPSPSAGQPLVTGPAEAVSTTTSPALVQAASSLPVEEAAESSGLPTTQAISTQADVSRPPPAPVAVTQAVIAPGSSTSTQVPSSSVDNSLAAQIASSLPREETAESSVPPTTQATSPQADMRILPPAPVAVNQAIITLGSSTSTQVPSSPAENRPGQPQNDPNGAKDDAASPVEVHGAVSEARPQASAPARDSKPALHAGEASALRPTETVKEPASPAISSGISSQNEQDGQERGGGKMSPDVGVSRDIAGMPEPPQPASPASLPQKTRSAGGRATSKVSASSRTPQATPNATELNRAPSTQAESENPIEQQRASAATTKQPPAEGRTLSFSVDKAIAPQQPRGPVISTGFKSTSTMKAGSPVIATVSPLRTQDSPKSSPSEAPRTRLSNASEH